MLGTAENELAYIAKHVEEDSKNYHAWSYRQWVLEHFNLWDGELSYLDNVIDLDPRFTSHAPRDCALCLWLGVLTDAETTRHGIIATLSVHTKNGARVCLSANCSLR
jgi:hypothetical protein